MLDNQPVQIPPAEPNVGDCERYQRIHKIKDLIKAQSTMVVVNSDLFYFCGMRNDFNLIVWKMQNSCFLPSVHFYSPDLLRESQSLFSCKFNFQVSIL
jgi:hypothetical protein